MAAAPLPEIVAAEAVGAVGVGAALLVWTGAAAARLALPPTPPSWAAVRLVAVLLIGLGLLLWATRARVVEDRAAVRALAVGHGLAAAVLALQYLAVWSTGAGVVVALVPLGLAVRYAQYGWRTPAPTAAAAPGA